MKFVYQTKIAGMLEPPALDSYRIAAVKLAALCPSRTTFKVSLVKDSLRETLGLITRAGANVLEKSGGSAVEPAANPAAAFEVIFASEIKKMGEVLSKKNFEEGDQEKDGSEDTPAEPEEDKTVFAVDDFLKETIGEDISGPAKDEEPEEAPETADEEPPYEETPLDFILSKDVVYIGSAADEDDILAIIAANIVFGHSQRIVLEFPPENIITMKCYIAAARSLGADVELADQYNIYVNGRKPFSIGGVILPASDWRIAVPGLCCSAIGFDVIVKNSYRNSPFAPKQFISVLSDMRLLYMQDEDGNSYFSGSSRKGPVRIDATGCGDTLPYILFLMTQIEGVSEIYNITKDVLDRNNRAFYYAAAELQKLGAEFRSKTPGSMFVLGKSTFAGSAKIDCHNNYDVAAVAVLATLCSKKANVIINDDIIDWVCPDFWRLFKSIGGFAE
ncbi:MAG: hypothetical protein IJS71_08660 [Clostridia bacterium]|nr:hypothetical protein [Clostridia bacterium]